MTPAQAVHYRRFLFVVREMRVRGPTSGRLLAAGLLVLVAGSGCSMRKLVVRQTADVLAEGMVTLESETDPDFAEAALPANLKMLESFLEVDPDNEALLELLAKGYTSYVWVFLEDRLERATLADDLEGAEVLSHRGRRLYLRARRYAFRLLDRPELERAALGGTVDEYEGALGEVTPEEAAALFWLANAWGGYVNLAKDDPAALAELTKVEATVARVVELDERTFFAGPHFVLGLFSAMRPKMLGGDPVKAKKHFERALGLTEGRFLFVPYLMARWYCVQEQDAALFRKLLQQVLDAPDDVLPAANLANAVAKRRARRWLDRIDVLFEDAGLPAPSQEDEDEAIDEAESDF